MEKVQENNTLAEMVRPLLISKLKDDGSLFTELNIGMPLLGRNNLSESALLKTLGDLQWQHMSKLTGIPSRAVADSNGERLYATFFYVEMNFPPPLTSADFGENNRLRIHSHLRRYGNAALDGFHFLPMEPSDISCDWRDPVRKQVPFVRMSNIFVKQSKCSRRLKKSRPAAANFLLLPALSNPPDSFATVKKAKETLRLFAPSPGWLSLNDEPMQVELGIDPERDVNGAGLLYFAHYPVFLDSAERELLPRVKGLKCLNEMMNKRAVVRRRSAYLANADEGDRIIVHASFWLMNPHLENSQDPGNAPLTFRGNFQMYRKSDGRLMMVSSVTKSLSETHLGGTQILEAMSSKLDGT